MRAFYYYDLATVFANVPIIDTPLLAEDKNSITKASKEEVQKFILSDLDAAIGSGKLPSAKSLSADELGRITQEAALSFRALAWKMFFGDYEGAKADLKVVVDSGCYELVDDYQKLFNSKTDGYMSKEGRIHHTSSLPASLHIARICWSSDGHGT